MIEEIKILNFASHSDEFDYLMKVDIINFEALKFVYFSLFIVCIGLTFLFIM